MNAEAVGSKELSNSFNKEDPNNPTPFLFNLTNNLRFNAVPNRAPPYFSKASLSQNKKEQWGNEELCIDNNYKVITSKIGNS